MKDSPYQGLNPYEEKDAIFFFGREERTREITTHLKLSRLTILHGESGVGKSSLVQAGVANYLRLLADENEKALKIPKIAVVIFKDWDSDDVFKSLLHEMRLSVAKAMKWEQDKLDDKVREKTKNQKHELSSNSNFVKELQALIDIIGGEKEGGQLFIILDQFELYLQCHSPSEKEDKFSEEFPRAINFANLDVHFLISIRSDELYRLQRAFQGKILNILNTDKCIELIHLNPEAAKQAITKPIERYNLIQHLTKARVTVLSGEKYAGKSLFVKANIIPYWRSQAKDYKQSFIYFHNWKRDPRKTDDILSLEEIIDIWKINRERVAEDGHSSEENLLIILDHFEEYFENEKNNENEDFEPYFKWLVTKENLPINVLIVINQKYNDKLKSFLEKFIPLIHQRVNRYFKLSNNSLDIDYFYKEIEFCTLAFLRGADPLGLSLLWVMLVQKWDAPDIDRQTRKKIEIAKIKEQSQFTQVITNKLIDIAQQKNIIITPFLQLLMIYLWKKTKSERRVISLDMVKKLGEERIQENILQTDTNNVTEGIKEIIKKYVEEKVKHIENNTLKGNSNPQTETNNIKYKSFQKVPFVLYNFSTSSGSKHAVNRRDILESAKEERNILKELELPALDKEGEDVKKILKQLDDSRILRPVGKESQTNQESSDKRYEIYFDGLIEPIVNFRNQHINELQQIRLKQNLPTESLAKLRGGEGELAALLAYKAYECYENDGYPTDLSAIDEALREVLKSSKFKSCRLHLNQDERLFWQIKVSPDGNLLAASDQSGNITLWQLNQEKENFINNNPVYKVIREAHIPKDKVQGQGDFIDVAMAFSADSKFLFSGARDGKIKIWNIDSNESAKKDPKETNKSEDREAFVSVAFNDKKNLLAASGWKGNIWLWKLGEDQNLEFLSKSRASNSGQQKVSEKKDENKWIWSVAFNPEGYLLAAGGLDGIVYLWNVENPKRPKLLRKLKGHGHTDEIFCVAFSPDGKWLASASRDYQILLWKMKPTGNKIIDRFLWHLLWKISPHLLTEHKGEIRSIGFDQDSKRLASASEDQSIHLWNLDKLDDEPEVLHGHFYTVSSVAFYPKKKESKFCTLALLRGVESFGLSLIWVMLLEKFDALGLVSCSWDRTIRLWNLQSEPKTFEHPRKNQSNNLDIDAITVQFVNEQQFAIGYGDGTVVIRNIRQFPDSPPEDKYNIKDQMSFWQKISYDPKVLWGKVSSDNASVIAFFSQDDHLKKVALSGSHSSTIWLWNFSEKKIIRIKAKGKIHSLAFSPDGNRLASGGKLEKKNQKEKKAFREVWDLTKEKPEHIPEIEKSYEIPDGAFKLLISVAYHPDFHNDKPYLAVSKNDKEIELLTWNTKENKYNEPNTLEHNNKLGLDASIVLAFSSDGQQFASACDAYSLKLWNIQNNTFNEYQNFPSKEEAFPHRNFWVTSVAFDPKNKWLASGRYDGNIQLWDLKDPYNKPIVLTGHTEKINAIAFSPDGNYLVSASSDNTVRLWTINTKDLANQLKNKLYRGLTDEEQEKYLGESTSRT